MEPFATQGDLEAYLGRALETTRADLFLDGASNEIRAFLRQQVNRATETVTLPLAGGRTLLLPELPVWSVEDVIVTAQGGDPTELEAADFVLVAGVDGRLGYLRRVGQSWPTAGEVTLTYDHGFDVPGDSDGAEHPLPGVFRMRCLAIAARALSNPTGNRQETIGRYSYTAGGAGDSLGLTLTLGDQSALEGYMPGSPAGARG